MPAIRRDKYDTLVPWRCRLPGVWTWNQFSACWRVFPPSVRQDYAYKSLEGIIIKSVLLLCLFLGDIFALGAFQLSLFTPFLLAISLLFTRQ
jgi:hypothetical protein